MTNGEMIQKVFNCEVCEPIIEDDIIHVIFADKKDSAIGLDWSWWNAEYKEPKTGHWIEKDDNLYECSECGQYIYSETEHDLSEFHAFCGRCGARMGGEQDDNRN